MIVIPCSFSSLKNSHDLDARPAVEIAGRLVGEQHFRIVDQRARDRDALLLSAGKLARVMILAARQTDRGEDLVRLVAQLRIRQRDASDRAAAAPHFPARKCARAD